MVFRNLKAFGIVAAFFLLFYPGQALFADSSRPVVIAEIKGAINPAKDDYLKKAILSAEEKEARLLVIYLDTPGGILSSTKNMVEMILNSPVPTVVYVTPSGGGAISAGVFITLSGHFAYMAPGTTIGAAHPVSGGGGNLQSDMREKLENYAASLARAIAGRRNRNAAWAEQAVRESVSMTAEEALSDNVIDGLASSLDSLLADLEGQAVTVKGELVSLYGLADAPREVVEMGARLRVIDVLCDPNVAIALGAGVVVGVLIELLAPGTFVGGAIALICFILSLISGSVLPLNYGGVALLVVSLLLFVVEFFVPSFGFWGVAGIVCLVLGGVYFIDEQSVWSSGGVSVALDVLVGLALALLVMIISVVYLIFGGPKRSLRRYKDDLVGQKAQVLKVWCGVERRSFACAKVDVRGKSYPAQIRIIDKKIPAPGAWVKVVDLDSTGKALVTEIEEGE